MKMIKNDKKRFVLLSIIVILLIIIILILEMKQVVISKTDNKEVKESINKNENSNDIEIDMIVTDEENEDNYELDENDKDSEDKNVLNNSTESSNKPSDKVDKSNISDKPVTNDNTNADKQNNNDNQSNKIDNESNISKPEIEEKPEVPPVQEDKNDVKRKNIESTYGVKILYGNEMGDYKPKGINPTKLTESSEIENYLNRLNMELAKYPKGFFNDFNKKGMPLKIYLIKSANGAFSGFTDYQFMNDIKLTLATDYNFEYTIHHELMHYIDCYLDIVMYPNDPYDEYEKLNPSDFTYGYANSNQIYNMASNQRGAYFISSYGATHVKEDRAEVFKFMMARAYKPIGCFEPNEVIRKKAEIISKQIKTYFPSVTDVAHWDRFIN